MKYLFTKIIIFYQKFLSMPISKFLEYFGLMRSNSCVFYPTCSEYTKQAIEKYGILRGIFLGSYRILRCHPWQKNHFDPVRDREGSQRPSISNGIDPLK